MLKIYSFKIEKLNGTNGGYLLTYDDGKRFFEKNEKDILERIKCLSPKE